jgi:hypothetical protein
LTGAIVSFRHYRTFTGDGVNDSLWSEAAKRRPAAGDGSFRMLIV